MKHISFCRNHKRYEKYQLYKFSFTWNDVESCNKCKIICYNCYKSVKSRIEDMPNSIHSRCEIIADNRISCFPCLSWRSNFTRLHWRNPMSLLWLGLKRAGVCRDLRKKILEYTLWSLVN